MQCQNRGPRESLDICAGKLPFKGGTNVSTRLRITLLLVTVLGLVSGLYAQGGANATILGTVTDSSGAVVANAKVEITNVATNVSTVTQTTSSGDFTVPFLSPGTYRVTVEATGFQKAVSGDVGLVVGQQQRVDVPLK